MDKTKPEWEVAAELSNDELWVSVMMVLQSAAGYYIGRLCAEVKTALNNSLYVEPYCRDSGYYKTKETAQTELDAWSYEVRDCVENNWARINGKL